MREPIYPVIMCGGSGTRLWPSSRADRPKQFLDLAGERSLFQDTVERVAPLAEGGGALIVVAGEAHRPWVETQLEALNREAVVLLEPEPRDSGPAMAAAAAYVARRDPEGVIAFVASDHHLPQGEAFRQAIRTAAGQARQGHIVTLGVRPTEPSAAYGYIAAEGPGLSAVRRFVEKPDRETAAVYLRDGYLWNSGNFIVSATVLLEELEAFAPEIATAARDAVADARDEGVVLLSSGFLNAPRISIDHAVMEKTRRAWVLPVDFAWSDLGAWDAVAAAGSGSAGVWIGSEGDQCLVRAAEGMIVATAGVSHLAIIAEPDAVLVCDLDRAQEVKGLVDRIRAEHPGHLGLTRPSETSLAEQASQFAIWMRTAALPIWAALGTSATGAFVEQLGLDGRAAPAPVRARVAPRQAQVFCRAGALGWAGPWRETAERGLDRFQQAHRRDDGLFRTLVDAKGAPLDDVALLYDQAFVLFALAAAKAAGVAEDAMAQAARLRERLTDFALPAGGWRSGGSHPCQANAQMHLLEAALAWEAVDPDPAWRAMSNQMVALALSHFIDSKGGFLREFFTETWTPAEGEDGRLVEPGHQFEWAWLLTLWGRGRSGPEAIDAARTLYSAGRRGVDERRGVALNALNDDFSIRDETARLWPQCEWLKAALLLAETAEGAAREALVSDASRALKTLLAYLTPAGLWRDTMLSDGSFVDEPAPASSFYHIMSAYDQLVASAAVLPELADCDLSLG